MTTRFRRRDTHPEVLAYIAGRALATDSNALAIHAAAETHFKGHVEQPAVPSARTVQAIVKQYRPPDPSTAWSLADAEEDEGRLVLPVIAELAERTQGARRYITNAEADWIVRVRRAALSLEPWQAFQIAALYRAKQARSESLVDLDLYLALSVWPSSRSDLAPVWVESLDGWIAFSILEPTDWKEEADAKKAPRRR